MTLIERLETLKDKIGYYSSRKICRMPTDLKLEIEGYLETEVFQSLGISEKIYWILNGLTDYPIKCLKCGTPITSFRSIQEGYISKFCSRSCMKKYHFDQVGRVVKPSLKTPEELKISNEKAKITRRNTCLTKFGVESPFNQGPLLEKRLKEKNLKYILSKIDEVSDKFKPLFDPIEYVSSKVEYLWRCRVCDCTSLISHANGQNLRCPICYTPKASKAQHEIADFVRNLGVNLRINDRSLLKRRELDIYIESHHLAIEYNGLYWHSEKAAKFSKEHLKEKMELARCYGVQVVNIFEDEWVNKPEIIQSMIRNRLGMSRRLNARECEIREISSIVSRQFLQDNHIQGQDNASIRVGLFFEGVLVSLMTFCRPRFNKTDQWEISRFCNILDTSVIGAASRLFTYFRRVYNPTQVISFADLRFGTGAVYQHLGFTKIVENTGPNYFYFRNNQIIRFSRVKFQKHKLIKLLETFDPTLTEVENMNLNGYHRVFDCGNAKWEWQA